MISLESRETPPPVGPSGWTPGQIAGVNDRLHALALSHDLDFLRDDSVIGLRDLARGGAHPGCAAESLRQAFVKLAL